MKLSATAAIWYLAALIDGEGCVAFYDYRDKKPSRIARHIVIQMCDREVLKFAARCLRRLEISHNLFPRKKLGPRRRPAFVLWIKPTQANVSKLASLLRLQHRGKRDRLKAMASSFLRRGRPRLKAS